jgi:hypothetical protein
MGSKKKVKANPAPPPTAELAPEGDTPEKPVEEAPESEGSSFQLRARAESVIAFIAALAGFHHLQSLTPYVVAVDAYFHQKMALLMRTQGPVKDFYWTTTSTFKDGFSDSSFLYHLLLIPFTYIPDEVFAIKLGATVFSALFIALFYWFLRSNRCRGAWFFTLLVLGCGSLFLYRLCQNRGYLLSMSLALLAVEACINRRYRLLAVIAVAYPLSYTAFQVVLVVAFLTNLSQWLCGETVDRKLLPIAGAGVVLGLLLHPNFPRDLSLWWVQNVKVLWFKWTSDVNLFFGGELYPPELKHLIKSTAAVFVTLVASVTAMMVCTRRRASSTITLFFVTLFFGLLTLLSKRFIEYSGPFAIALGAFLLRDFVTDEDLDRGLDRHPYWFSLAVGLVMTLLAGILVHSYRDVRRDLMAESEPGLKAGAEWLQKNTAKDDIVYTADWDDFPQLFYYNHYNRFLICLDPMFFYDYDKDLWQTWFNTSNVRLQDVYNPIAKRFHAKYVLATNDFSNLIKKCNADPRFRKMYVDKHCTIFKVLEDLPFMVTTWSVSGAYKNDQMTASESLVLASLANPNTPVPPSGGIAVGLTWKPWPAEKLGSFLDLEAHLKDGDTRPDYTHAYAACRIGSEVDQDAELRFGFDDAVSVWLDGQNVLDDRGPSEVSIDARRVPIKLKKGVQTLVVRCANYTGNWGFMARLEPKLRPVTYSPVTDGR